MHVGACAHMYMYIIHACTCMWLTTLVISVPLKYCAAFDVCMPLEVVRYCPGNASRESQSWGSRGTWSFGRGTSLSIVTNCAINNTQGAIYSCLCSYCLEYT